MAWHCPSCQTIIQSNDVAEKPRRGVSYRCHICRADLTYFKSPDKLRVVSYDARRVPAINPKATRVHPVRPRKPSR